MKSSSEGQPEGSFTLVKGECMPPPLLLCLNKKKYIYFYKKAKPHRKDRLDASPNSVTSRQNVCNILGKYSLKKSMVLEFNKD